MSAIIGYHAHVYFKEAELEAARRLCEGARDRFGLSMGRMHAKPVGPHPTGSCQLTVAPDQLGEVIAWLMVNRGALTIFVHGLSGNDLTDHTQYAMWLGQSAKLNLSIFEA